MQLVKYADSLDKIVQCLTHLEVGRYEVALSPFFFRSHICPSNCGACCLKFSLDYITEESQKEFKLRYPEECKKYFTYREYNGHQILSTNQMDDSNHCQFLNEFGRCSIHDFNPLSCQIEPIKFKLTKNRVYILKSFYRNSWRMTRIDGEKGCMCKFGPYTKEQYTSDLKVLRDLNDVAVLFEIETVIPDIIDVLKKLGPTAKPKNKIVVQTIGMDRLDKWR